MSVRLKDLGHREFELDRKLRKYQQVLEDNRTGKRKVSMGELASAQTEIEFTEPKLRAVQKKLYGWRSVEAIYEKDKPGYQGYLEERLLDLENKEIGYQKTLSGYQGQVDHLEAEIAALINATDGDENRLREAKQQLLDCHEQYHIAETGLPMVQAELEELRKELEAMKAGTAKAHGLKQTWESVSAEISGRAMEKVHKYGIEYSLAVSQVLREDPELARRYVFET